MADLTDMVVEVRVRLPAPRDRVFALLTDVEQIAGLGPEHSEARWTSDGPALGATFVGRNARDGREWEVPCRVVVLDPPRAFGWTVGDDAAPLASWTYELLDEGEATEVVQRFQHGPGASFLSSLCDRRPERAERYVSDRAGDLEANMRTVLRAVATRLETARG